MITVKAMASGRPQGHHRACPPWQAGRKRGTGMTQSKRDEQAEVIGFLMSPGAFPADGQINHIETHSAHVFLCGEVALKIKRAVRYDYLDQSTPELRQALVQRELDLNRSIAPMIYRDVVPITRAPGGGLELSGSGPPVEWALRMHRFAADCEMPEVAASGRLTDAVAEALGGAVQGFHAACPRRSDPGDALIRDILDELGRVLAEFDTQIGSGVVDVFLGRARKQLADLAQHLRDRAANGHVRRVHGDLHLRNLLLIEGQPVLFDALEFDERLATCDVLYDLAFLLMDLCHRDLGRQANAAMTAYLLAAARAEDAGLSALPLFMAVRGAIRAMVLLQTDLATGHSGESLPEARRYLTEAARYLQPKALVLIAVGGVSGTGKTVLARDLAKDIGACPGPVHLRTDTERKAEAHPVSYAPAARSAVYAHMLARAANILAAGRSVILDGTFLDLAQRRAAQGLALRQGVAFRGFWLTAPLPVLTKRVTSRQGDASDADAAVVAAQIASLDAPVSDPGWETIDAGGSPDATRAAASAALGSLVKGASSGG
ncbi:MAG: kinase [Rhodobacter sp.]|nr:kinase [Rhodobacter sp.]